MSFTRPPAANEILDESRPEFYYVVNLLNVWTCTMYNSAILVKDYRPTKR